MVTSKQRYGADPVREDPAPPPAGSVQTAQDVRPARGVQTRERTQTAGTLRDQDNQFVIETGDKFDAPSLIVTDLNDTVRVRIGKVATETVDVTKGLDTFVGSSNLDAHTADVGFGSYEYSAISSQFVVGSGICTKQFAAAQFARSTNDIVNDNFEMFVEASRSAVDNSIDKGGIYWWGDKVPAAASIVGGGAIVFFERTSGTTVEMNYELRNDAGVVQFPGTILLASGIPISPGGGLRLGVTVTAGDVQAFTEPLGGGTRTLRGTSITPFIDLRDTDHLRMGLFGEQDWEYDDLTVTQEEAGVGVFGIRLFDSLSVLFLDENGLIDGSIDTDAIADGAVTFAKLSTEVQQLLVANPSTNIQVQAPFANLQENLDWVNAEAARHLALSIALET